MSKFSAEEVSERVCAIVARDLACDSTRVIPTAILMSGLGASRSDFNHIKADLEQAFSIQLGAGDFDELACGPHNEDPAFTGGVVSPSGLARLRQLIPEAAERIQPGLRFHDVLGLFRVQTLINLVMAVL